MNIKLIALAIMILVLAMMWRRRQVPKVTKDPEPVPAEPNTSKDA